MEYKGWINLYSDMSVKRIIAFLCWCLHLNYLVWILSIQPLFTTAWYTTVHLWILICDVHWQLYVSQEKLSCLVSLHLLNKGIYSDLGLFVWSVSAPGITVDELVMQLVGLRYTEPDLTISYPGFLYLLMKLESMIRKGDEERWRGWMRKKINDTSFKCSHSK